MPEPAELTFAEMLRQLLEAAGVEVAAAPAASGRQAATGFFVFPSLAAGRVMVPFGLPLRRYWRSLDIYPTASPLQSLKKMAVVGIKLVNDVVPVPVSKIHLRARGMVAKDLYVRFARGSSGADRVASVSIRRGSIGKGLKLVLQFTDAEGRVLSYVKVGDDRYRGTYLRNEARILETLPSRTGTLFDVPAVLGLVETGPFTALELSPMAVATHWSQPPLGDVAQLLGGLACATASAEVKPLAWDEAATAALVGEGAVTELIGGAIGRIGAELFPRPLCHRDLTSWHVVRERGGRIGVIDWEFGRSDHLPFVDLFHYLFHSAINFSRRTVGQVYEALFFHSAAVPATVRRYADAVGVRDPGRIFDFFVLYLYDWYAFERSRAAAASAQGWRHRELLRLLAERRVPAFAL